MYFIVLLPCVCYTHTRTIMISFCDRFMEFRVSKLTADNPSPFWLRYLSTRGLCRVLRVSKAYNRAASAPHLFSHIEVRCTSHANLFDDAALQTLLNRAEAKCQKISLHNVLRCTASVFVGLRSHVGLQMLRLVGCANIDGTLIGHLPSGLRAVEIFGCPHDSPPSSPFVHSTSQHATYLAHHITSHHITSHHITSHMHITSHHITSHHITSHHITSHHTSSGFTSTDVERISTSNPKVSIDVFICETCDQLAIYSVECSNLVCEELDSMCPDCVEEEASKCTNCQGRCRYMSSLSSP